MRHCFAGPLSTVNKPTWRFFSRASRSVEQETVNVTSNAKVPLYDYWHFPRSERTAADDETISTFNDFGSVDDL
jgi:hypothetical protein